MELAKVASTAFVLIDADWPAARVLELIERLVPSRLIVRRNGPPETYYLVKPGIAKRQLQQVEGSSRVDRSLDWAKLSPAPLADGRDDESLHEGPCVVHDEGTVIGFVEGGTPTAFEAATRDFSAPDGGTGGGGGQSLLAEFPEKVQLDATASLLVSLVREFIPGASLAINLSQGSEIDIVVQARRGFTLEGPAEGKLVVSGEEEGMPLQFKLKATAAGTGQVRVLAFHTGRPLGMITLSPVVVESAGEVSASSRSSEGTLAPATVRVPDLSLLILESLDQGQTVLNLRLTSADPSLGYNLKLFGPIKLQSEPYAYFQTFFGDIEKLPVQSVQDKAKVEQRLAAKGANLFEQLVPEELRGILWKLRTRITSVQVQSEEPWIPWELCKLYGKSAEGDEIEDGPFFCEAFQLTRWIPGVAQIPQLRMKKLAVVVPDDSQLRFAPLERDYVLSLKVDGRDVEPIPATFLDVQSALASGLYDGWHFSGHGSFRNEPQPDRSAMILQGGDRLTPEDLSGRVANLGRPHPLVFLNACQIGQAGMGLTGMGGWASRFLKSGAGAFLGAYWSIYDEPALNFAKTFYERLLAGDPIGKAAQSSRLAVRGSGDPTWLAYTVFADPLCTVAS
jgi:hypothetical protein